MATTDNPTLYKSSEGVPSDSITVVRMKAGDSIVCTERVLVNSRNFYYRIESSTYNGWVSTDQVVPTSELLIKAQPTAFKVHKSKSDEVWARGAVWVAKYASVRVQLSSENIIETYNPSGYQYAFLLTRVPVGDSVAFEVNPKGEASKYRVRYCAYYMLYGYDEFSHSSE